LAAGTGAEHHDVVRDAFPGGAARNRRGIGRALYSAEPARVSGCASLALDVTGPVTARHPRRGQVFQCARPSLGEEEAM
jgi:hypothetical protein